MEELTITANGGKHIKKPNSTPIVTFKLEFVPINVEPVNMPEPPYTIDSNGEFIYYFQTTDESYDITYASFWMLGADYEYTIENNIGILRVYNPQKDLEIIINNTWIENGYSKYSFNDQVLTIAAIDQEHNAIKAEDYAEFREIPEIEIYHGIIEIGEDAF